MRVLRAFIGALVVTSTQIALASEPQCFDAAATYATEAARAGLSNRYSDVEVEVSKISAVTPWGLSENFGIVRRFEISGDLSYISSTGKKISGTFSTKVEIARNSGKCSVVVSGPVEK